MAWSLAEGHIVLAHDLDSGTTLALTPAGRPSVLRVRGHWVLPEHLGRTVPGALGKCQAELVAGALAAVEAPGSRARILPYESAY